MLYPSGSGGRRRRIRRRACQAPTRKQANHAFKRFINHYAAIYPKATKKLEKDREALLAFFGFLA
jgi:putative transposase